MKTMISEGLPKKYQWKHCQMTEENESESSC